MTFSLKINILIKKQKQYTPEHTESFGDRVVNITPIQFNKEETELINKVLQYNLSYNNSRHWLESIIIETEVAISKLPINQHEGFRYLAKQNILKMINKKT
jgi:hypothetical protein